MSDGNRKDGSGASEAHPKGSKDHPTKNPSAESSPNINGGYSGERTNVGDEGAGIARKDRGDEPKPKT